jgi:hypothetical protein
MNSKPPRSMDWCTKEWNITVALSISPLYLVFLILGNQGQRVTAFMSAYTIVFLTRYLWDLRTRIWFWIVLGLIVGSHAYVILLISIPMPKVRLTPFGMLLPIFAVHFFLLRGVFWVMEKVMEPTSPSLPPAADDPPSISNTSS